ncbi:MAG TPA: Hpt domain-containing protein [Casimicrobiaceae bacterium]
MPDSTDFDLGPLSWVQGEIDQALGRGLDALALHRDSGDGAALKHARAHIHQAAGAIQMVGLDAVVAFTDEIERQLTRLDDAEGTERTATLAAVDRACRKLRIFLDELTNGVAPVPLKLFPEYEAMQSARGIKAAAPTDLFYPDLSARPPRITPREIVPANKLPSHLIKQRRLYQRGLLGWLRGDEDGGRTMRDAIAGIEDVTTQSGLRAFWWTVGALFEAMVEKGLEPGFGVKQLAARIDLQIRRVAEGSAKVADRLRREVLYYVAIAAPVAPQVQAVQRAFRLGGLIPSAQVLSADVVRIQPLLREAREQLAGAKDAWLKAASGRAENLPKLKQTLASVHNKAAEIKHGALMKLTAALVERLDKMPASGVSEPLAMEYATALLLAESAFENYTSLSADFPKQVDAMLARLDAARAGRAAAASGPMLDEMSKRAQERVLLAQVGREIQANLRHMEQVLDAFFRDQGKRAELATLTKDSAQIRGALRMLGLDDAGRLLELCQEQIDAYASEDTPVNNDDLELLAESLSGLGFYIEAVEQQRPDRERLIAPLLAKRLGEAPAQPAAQSDSVESAVAELRAQLPEIVAEVHRAPADAAARERLEQKLTGLRDDAELIGDADLVTQADAALKQLESGGTAALAAAVEQIADTGAAPAPEISEETQRLLDTDASQLDAELLEIYLTEAAEVLDAIADNRAALERNAGDREALAVVRRQFHTLKGSGRMVGLTQLGDVAYEVEKIHNRLLEEDRPVTPAVIAMIATAEADFRRWVDALQSVRRVQADPAPIEAAIRAVEVELGGGAAVRAAPQKPLAIAPPPPPAPPKPRAPDLEIVDLPELGAAVDDLPHVATEEEPYDETIDVALPTLTEPGKPVLRVVADNTQPPAPPFSPPPRAPSLTLAEPVHTPSRGARDASTPPAPSAREAAAEEPVEPEPASSHTEPAPPEPEPEDVVVGGVTLSQSLWKILCDEAEQHLATLAHELSLLQFDSRYVPSEAMVRASHTLCGIHRTGGFPLIAGTAKALEQALLALQQHGAPLPSAAQPVLARAIAGLSEFATRVRARFGFMSAHEQEGAEIQRELEALRQDAMLAEPVDAETVAAQEADREEAQPPQEDPVAPAEAGTEGPDESHWVPASAGTTAAPSLSQERQAVEPHHAPRIAPLPPLRAVPPIAPAEITLPKPVEAERDTLLALHDEVDETVLSIFLEEAGDLFPQAGEQVRAWRRNPGDASVAQQLRRTLHTFKGSARMAGAMRLGELTHRMESRLMDGESLAEATPELFEALDTDLDHVSYVLDALRAGRTNVPLPWLVASAGQEQAAPSEPHAAGQAVAAAAAPAAAAPVAPARGEPATEVETAHAAMLRVRADTVDRLVNEAGEVAIARARVEGELRALKANLLELTSSVIRLRSQVREIELQAETQIQSRMSALSSTHEQFDPLELDRYTRFQELTRSLAEGVNDVSTVQQSLLRNLDDADAALLAQARLSRDVQQRLFAIRTVPFGSLSERLYRIMRTTARELDKRANLEIHGAQTELDRSVLEKLVGPLEHLLRNSLDHGLESREARQKAGKAETGEISLTVKQVGNEILIELADDGAGIDFARVRERARSVGLVAADADPGEQQLIECLFQPGFSTASKVTQISGRGIGMDVVRSEIAALGGRVEVQSAPGKGTQFDLYLPLTLAVAQAVLVRAGGRLWALPAPMVEQVQQVKGDVLLSLYVARAVQWQGRDYPFHYLPRLLGDMSHNPETLRYNAVLLLRSGQGVAAVHVDEMVGNQEVVVKNIGPQLARVSGISGATVLGTGEIVLIINPVHLAQRADVATFDPHADDRIARTEPARPARDLRPTVMIVDDSLTVRKITSRLLAREGFDVLTAKDGVDALQVLTEHMPDVILLDIEMPRMDGFEFTKTIKGDPKNAHIPIIMITSRTAEKHRNHAAELGVDLYLGKPYQEDELLRHLRDMLNVTAPRG